MVRARREFVLQRPYRTTTSLGASLIAWVRCQRLDHVAEGDEAEAVQGLRLGDGCLGHDGFLSFRGSVLLGACMHAPERRGAAARSAARQRLVGLEKARVFETVTGFGYKLRAD